MGQFSGWLAIKLHVNCDGYILVQKAKPVQSSTLVRDLTDGSSRYDGAIRHVVLHYHHKGYEHRIWDKKIKYDLECLGNYIRLSLAVPRVDIHWSILENSPLARLHEITSFWVKCVRLLQRAKEKDKKNDMHFERYVLHYDISLDHHKYNNSQQ